MQKCPIYNGTRETLIKIQIVEDNYVSESKSFVWKDELDVFVFKGYRSRSDIAIFAWRVTLNYAYSPFNSL